MRVGFYGEGPSDDIVVEKLIRLQLQCQMVLVVVDCDKNDFGHWRDKSHDSAQCPKCQRENDLSNTQKQVGASAPKYCVGMPVPIIESWFAHSASIAKSKYSHLKDIAYPEQKDKVTLKNLLYRSNQTDLSIVSQIMSLFKISEYQKAKETCVSFRYFVDEIDCS